MQGTLYQDARTLSRQEAQVVAWLEAERLRKVTTDEVAEFFGWPRPAVRKVVGQLAKKGWLRRVARGRYETVLAETGGFASADPWPALSQWQQPYYVGFRSAAYEHGLTPDRPGQVQVVVPVGARRPVSWEEQPISLIYLRSFSPLGIDVREIRGWPVAMAVVERVLIDGASLLSRMGGLPGLNAVLMRAGEKVDWETLIAYAERLPRGQVSLRRLAALLELGDAEVPKTLAAAVHARGAPIYLGERRIFGSHGRLLKRWNVIDNVGVRLTEELEH
jgi:predicted transcriptional regulator of viral defense system